MDQVSVEKKKKKEEEKRKPPPSTPIFNYQGMDSVSDGFASLPKELVAKIIRLVVLEGKSWNEKLCLIHPLAMLNWHFAQSVKKDPVLCSLMRSACVLNDETRKFRKKRILFLGQGGVGKLTLMMRFYQGEYIQEFDPQISCWDFEGWIKQSVFGFEKMMICSTILNCSPQEVRFIELSIIETQPGGVLAFCYSNAASFDYIENLIQFVHERYFDCEIGNVKTYKFVLVQLKADLEDSDIPEERVEKLKQSLNCQSFVVSSKWNQNVEELFQHCAEIGSFVDEEKQKDKEKEKPKNCVIF
jgi:GTPase SAR1 family protein